MYCTISFQPYCKKLKYIKNELWPWRQWALQWERLEPSEMLSNIENLLIIRLRYFLCSGSWVILMRKKCIWEQFHIITYFHELNINANWCLNTIINHIPYDIHLQFCDLLTCIFVSICSEFLLISNYTKMRQMNSWRILVILQTLQMDKR